MRMTWLRRRLARPAVSADTLHAKVQLCRTYEALGPRGRRVLLFIAARLEAGAQHGDFDPGRDWSRERAEERADTIVYEAAELVRDLERAEAAR